MATTGMKQPFWIAADRKTVMTKADGPKRVHMICDSFSSAHEECGRAIADWQYRTYGHVDPAADFRKYAP